MRPGALAAAVACLPLAAGAQSTPRPQQPAPTFRTGIELVQIDVVVVDQTGAHVRGLKAGDFAITDRKKPQTIAAFEEVTHERPRASEPRPADSAAPVRMDVANNQSVQANRLVVMVIDDLHIYRGRTDLSKKIAKDVLAELGGNASMAVMFTSGEHSTEVTEDRAVLLAAVDTLKGRKAIRRPNAAIDSQRARGEGDIGRANTASLQDFFDNMSQYKVLEDAARVLGAGDVRRKAFVLISEGVAKDLTGIFDSATTPCEAKCAACPCYHDLAVRKMMNSLRRSNVVSYNIDPRGHVPAHEIALELFGVTMAGEGAGEIVEDDIFRWRNPVRQAQDGLSIVAEASGGFAIVDTDNFTAGVGRIIDDLDHYYLLGFYPSDPKGNSYRPIDLSIPDHPEWTVRFRKGYRPEGPPKPPTNKNALAAMMSGTLPVSSLPLRLSAVPLTPASGDESRVALTIEVSAPAAALREADGKFRDELSYEIVLVNEQKARVRSMGGQKAKLTLSSTADGRPLPDVATYQIAETVTMRPGRYQLRVAAESGKAGSGGSVYLHLAVPDFQKEPLTVSGLAMAYAEGSRVPSAVAERPRAPARRGFVPPPPPPPALPFAPTLDRTFRSTDTLRVYFEVARKDARATLTGVLDVEGTDGDRARVTLPFTPDERGRVLLQLPMSRLAPGSYVLRATVTSGANTATRAVGIAVSEAR